MVPIILVSYITSQLVIYNSMIRYCPQGGSSPIIQHPSPLAAISNASSAGSHAAGRAAVMRAGERARRAALTRRACASEGIIAVACKFQPASKSSPCHL